MDDLKINLSELLAEIEADFEALKEEIKLNQYRNMDDFVSYIISNLDTLVFKVKYETEKFVESNLINKQTTFGAEK